MQAGREIRVIVQPHALDDDGATLLSHEIAREIEKELQGVQGNQLRSVSGMKSFHVTTTFGCQMNEHDSERGEGLRESLGYQVAERGDATSSSSTPARSAEGRRPLRRPPPRGQPFSGVTRSGSSACGDLLGASVKEQAYVSASSRS